MKKLTESIQSLKEKEALKKDLKDRIASGDLRSIDDIKKNQRKIFNK